MMGNSTRTESVVRFHDFQVNLETGEVWKAGVRLRLQDQPFKVLAALLRRPGQIVTREELRQLIWPEASFGDFDHAINLAVAKLRAVLGDSADVPHLIETLPRRGYRFIAPIENLRAEVEEPASIVASPQTARWKARLASTKGMALVFSLLGFLVFAPVILLLNLRSPQPRVVDFVQITKDGLANDIDTRLLTDGSRVYFEKRVPEGIALMQVSTEGGETARIPVSLELPFAYDISPNRSELLVGGGVFKESSLERPLWVVPLTAGPPHRVGDILAHDACWAPDGLHLVYLNGKDLFVAKPDGSEIRKLATADGFTDTIRFSPDGTRLRFSDYQGENSENVMEIGADGSRLHRLPIQGQSGTWSASGEYYFYSTSRDIWVLPERRSIFGEVKLGTSVQLTACPLAFSAPLPSADGTRLFVIGIQTKGRLIHYNSKSNQFVPFLGGISAAELEISPDGQWVAYTTYPESNLWRSKLDGSERLQLTFAPINAHEPRWSPDGKQILFTDVPSKIFVVPAEGGTRGS